MGNIEKPNQSSRAECSPAHIETRHLQDIEALEAFSYPPMKLNRNVSDDVCTQQHSRVMKMGWSFMICVSGCSSWYFIGDGYRCPNGSRSRKQDHKVSRAL